jgi:hypothetical protein
MRGGTSRGGGHDQFERQHRNAAGLAGLVIQFDSKTMLHGQGSPRLLADLRVGDQLRDYNAVLAEEVERREPKSIPLVERLIISAA